MNLRGSVASPLLLYIMFVAAGAVPSWAAVWDVTDDFSLAGNPNGQWSYGWEQDPATNWTQFRPYDTTFDDGARAGWYAAGISGDLTPQIWLNTGSSPWYDVDPRWLSIHPGPGSQPSVVRWTAPTSGFVWLRGLFGAGDTGAMDVYIQHNGSTKWSSLDFTTDQSFSGLGFSVSASDKIDWLVTGGYYDGNTPIDIEVELVPEPSLGILLLVGTVPIGIIYRRRKRATA